METIYDQTVETARQIEDLKIQLKTLEFNKQKKLVELRNIKKEVSAIQANSDVLVTRDIALREKFNELDETVRGASELVSKDTKRFFKKLGLKVKIEEIPDNLLELEIKFVESRDHSATFVYDSVTEDYDREFNNFHVLESFN